MDKIIDRKEGFTQVCVWPDCVVGSGHEAAFEGFMLQAFGVRVQYLEEVVTNPTVDECGYYIPGTGYRNDIIFAVHDDDVGKFTIPRLREGIRWIDDVLEMVNRNRHMYDCERLDQYRSRDEPMTS